MQTLSRGTLEEYSRLIEILEKTVSEGKLQAISRDEMLSLKGYGLFPEVISGKIMLALRIRAVAGRVSPEQMRTIGELALKHGRDYLELTDRQGFQIHYLNLEGLRETIETLLNIGLTTKGGCGDTARAITTCPVADVDEEQEFNVIPTVESVDRYYYENWEVFGNLPRKFKVSILACPYHCTDPEEQCLSFIGVKSNGEEGFTVLVGGGLSASPRSATHMPVFIPPDTVCEFIRALVDIWRNDPKYRVRHRSRVKFLVEDYGVDKLKELIEERLKTRLSKYEKKPVRIGVNTHVGVHRQRTPDLYYVGVPVVAGRITGEQAKALADIVEEYGENGSIRVTPQQNIVLTNIPENEVEKVVEKLGKLGFKLNSRWAALSVACPSRPFCIYGHIEGKALLQDIVEHLERTVGQAGDIRVNISGCVHDCGKSWIAEIGLKGTSAREGGEVKEYVDVYVGPPNSKRHLGRFPAANVKLTIERLIKAYLSNRRSGESFSEFYARADKRVLGGIVGGDN